MELNATPSATDLNASIPAMVTQRATTRGAATVLRKKDRGLWKAVSWSELDSQRVAIARALLALDFRPGDVAGMIADTAPHTVYADLGILTAGGVSVAAHPDDEAEAVRHVLRESACRVLFVENEEQLDKVLSVRESCPALMRIVILDMKGLRDFSDPGCESFDVFMARGSGQAAAAAAMPAIRADHPALMLFERGATAPGRLLTHADVLAKVTAGRGRLGVRAGDERLAVLPMSDPAERILGLYVALDADVISNYLESTETARENLQEVKPTLFGADAEAWTRLYDRITAAANAATALQRGLYRWALRAGRAGGLTRALANSLVLRSVRNELGMGRLRVAFVAGTSPAPDIMEWGAALGIVITTVEV